MKTVKEAIEALQKLPPDSELMVGIYTNRYGGMLEHYSVEEIQEQFGIVSFTVGEVFNLPYD